MSRGRKSPAPSHFVIASDIDAAVEADAGARFVVLGDDGVVLNEVHRTANGEGRAADEQRRMADRPIQVNSDVRLYADRRVDAKLRS